VKVATGIRRLDDLLEGGVPPLSATLVYGPPFVGKETFARLFILQGLRNGEPGILVLTNEAAADARDRFLAMDPDFPKYEAAGLIRYVDAYSKAIGLDVDVPGVELVDGPMNLNGLATAVANTQRAIVGLGPTHRLVVDSLSTLITYTNPQTTFRFLQVLIGKTRRAGATALFTLDHGMHTDAEVQMFKHIASGVLSVKPDQGKYLLNIQGIGVAEDRGWVDYKFSDTGFEITGSFAAGRIR